MIWYAYIIFIKSVHTEFGDVILWNTDPGGAHLVGLRDNSERGMDLCFLSVVCCQGEGS